MSIIIPLGKGKKRIELSDMEVLLLREMLIHRVMKSRDVHGFYKDFSEKPPHTSSITKRLTRLVNTGVLHRLEESLDNQRPSVKWYYYKLAKKGLDALVEKGFLKSNELESVHKQILSLKIPKPHNLAMSTLVSNICTKCMKKHIVYEHDRGGGWVEKQERDLPFMPDWVFEKGNKLIFLEVDSGSEQLSMIEQKVKRYMDYCYTNSKEVVVVFSIVDTSIDRSLMTANRSKRIASLKETMPPIQSWPNNLSIYVLSAERTTDLIIRLFEEGEPLPAEYRGYVMDNWIENWETRTPFTIYPMDRKESYGEKSVPQLEADVVIQLSDRTGTRTVALVYGEEGSVKTYQQIRYNHIRTCKSVGSGVRLDEVMVIYFDKDAVDHDVHGIHSWRNAWFTFRQAWVHPTNEGAYPTMLKPISPLRKEWIPFE